MSANPNTLGESAGATSDASAFVENAAGPQTLPVQQRVA
jgi:hypothetical protein